MTPTETANITMRLQHKGLDYAPRVNASLWSVRMNIEGDSGIEAECVMSPEQARALARDLLASAADAQSRADSFARPMGVREAETTKGQ